MRYVDSTRVALDDTCPRARYWGFEYQGRGLAPVEPNADLQFGLAIAEGVDQLRRFGVVALPVAGCFDADVLQAALLEAYHTRVWPQWLTEFDLIATEIEVTIPLSADLTYMARPDAVIRRKADGAVFVLSDKTTALNPETFVRLWDKAMQNHVECLAVEHTLQLQVSGFYTQGWYKGYKKDKTIYSPLCYAWTKDGQPGLVPDRWSEKYVPGWARRRIDQHPGGIAGWVAALASPVITQQFPIAGPIGLRRDLAETFLKQVLAREGEIATHPEPEHYPQRFQHCDEFGKYRRPCSFKECCWVPMVTRDPLGNGLFALRQSHHITEQLGV